MIVTSKTGIPERSQLYVDRLNVGTESWIGRVPIPEQTQWSLPLSPSYLAAPESNVNIHNQIGITVDGRERATGVHVITSYSIHYTKLYD